MKPAPPSRVARNPKHTQFRAVFACLAWLLCCNPARSAEIVVFAAASLTDALKEMGTHYSKSSQDRILFNFGASSTLAIQIREGAPADVFFSADESRMNDLSQRRLLLESTRTNILRNSLVVVAPTDFHHPFRNLEDLQSPSIPRIALADPRSVPAGVYARGLLEQKGLWTGVQKKVIPTENVRAALAAVESGNVPVALVYKTDALISTKVKVILEIPPQEGPSIIYPVAVLQSSRQPRQASAFVQYLASTNALRIFRKHGFLTPD